MEFNVGNYNYWKTESFSTLTGNIYENVKIFAGERKKHERTNLCLSYILPCICDIFKGIEFAQGKEGTGHSGIEQIIHKF